jgi:TonB family protein
MSPAPGLPQTLSHSDALPAGWNLKRWLFPLLMTLLLHLLFFQVLPALLRAFLPAGGSAPRRTEISTLSPRELDRLRDRIRAADAKRLLIDKSRPDVEPEDQKFKDADTISSRNRRVKKETLARENTATVPRPEGGGQAPPLSRLGVPLPGVTGKRNAPKASNRRAGPGTGPGARQNLLDDSLADGAENLLNTRSSRFYSFYSRIYESIGPLWESRARDVPRQNRLAPGDYITKIEVILDERGSLKDLRIFESAGVRAFDQAVLDSWRKLERFPNPPRELLEKDGLLHMGWTFSFRLENGAGVRFLPPRRGF